MMISKTAISIQINSDSMYGFTYWTNGSMANCSSSFILFFIVNFFVNTEKAVFICIIVMTHNIFTMGHNAQVSVMICIIPFEFDCLHEFVARFQDVFPSVTMVDGLKGAGYWGRPLKANPIASSSP